MLWTRGMPFICGQCLMALDQAKGCVSWHKLKKFHKVLKNKKSHQEHLIR